MANLSFKSASLARNNPFKPTTSTKFKQILSTIWRERGRDYRFPLTESSLFKKSGLVYYIRFTSKIDGKTIYKIGYTTTSIHFRLFNMGINPDYETKILAQVRYDKASFAYAIEQLVHARYARFIYKGKGILANGNTECYGRDVLGLDGEGGSR